MGIGVLALPVVLEPYCRGGLPRCSFGKSLRVGLAGELPADDRLDFARRRCFSSHHAMHPAREKKRVAQHTCKRELNVREAARCAENGMKQGNSRKATIFRGKPFAHASFLSSRLRRSSVLAS